LNAEILLDRDSVHDRAFPTRPSLPPQLANSDLAIKQKNLQAGAYILLRHLGDAERNLHDAEDLSERLHSSLTGEIARSRGLLELRRNDLRGADLFFPPELESRSASIGTIT